MSCSRFCIQCCLRLRRSPYGIWPLILIWIGICARLKHPEKTPDTLYANNKIRPALIC